jgi:hypothetical protein
MYQIGEIVGYVAVAASLFLYVGKTRDQISIAKIVVESILLVSVLLCELYLLAVLGTMAIVRQSIFHFRGKKAWADSKFWLYFFLAFTIVSPIVEFSISGWEKVTLEQILLALMPTIGSILATFGYYVKNTLHSRILITPSVFLYGIYNIIILYIPSIVSFGLSVISLVIGYINEFNQRKKVKLMEKYSQGEPVKEQNS